MTGLIFGALLAITLFWVVGANNRLIRLRTQILRNWSNVDAVWLRLLVRLQGGIAARQSLADPTEAQELQELELACEEMLEALSQFRLQPLDWVSQKKLGLQHLKLVGHIRLMLQTGHDAIKPDLEIAVNRMRQTLPAALIPYHVAVAAYNEALCLPPASFLARVLNMQPAMKMELSLGPA